MRKEIKIMRTKDNAERVYINKELLSELNDLKGSHYSMSSLIHTVLNTFVKYKKSQSQSEDAMPLRTFKIHTNTDLLEKLLKRFPRTHHRTFNHYLNSILKDHLTNEELKDAFALINQQQ